MTDKSTNLIKANDNSLPVTSDYRTDIQAFENNLLAFIGKHGLPTDKVLVPVVERIKVFNNVEDVLAQLLPEYKAQSIYVSKFIAAAASGLFDAALNYLWDETIHELRKRIVRYDLEYFFDLAVKNTEKRKKVSTEDDLISIDDYELIRAASEIGLISELGYKQLDLIRYMRNWASAAHPNQNELRGLQLISWFETCIKEVITLPETNTSTQIRILLDNIRKDTLDKNGARQVATFFVDLNSEQSNNLMSGFFGIYTNDKSIPTARTNVNLLAPTLWPLVDETTRKGFGVKYQQFVANSETVKSQWAREFLDAVGGASYIPDGIRAAEIETALEELLAAHTGMNNFSVEPSFARRLKTLIGDTGAIPGQIIEPYIMTLVNVFLTNDHGVSWEADPIYQSLLAKFDATQALLAILSFRNRHISSKLQFDRCKGKYHELLNILKPKISSPQGLEIIAVIENYKPPIYTLREDTRLMERVTAITKSMGF